MTAELYEPLIERDLEAFSPLARSFLRTHSADELWLAVARFAVLAYAPSQHAKRAVMACLAAHELREELGDLWVDMILACARYAAESRQPWSEPPLLDPPDPSTGHGDELRQAMRDGDRNLAERWLSAHRNDAKTALRQVAHGDALLMLRTAAALVPLLGEKGMYALYRMPVWELIADPHGAADETPVDILVARAAESQGSPDAVTAVFYAVAAERTAPSGAWLHSAERPRLEAYPLARDYAQTLIAHSYAPLLSERHAIALLGAVDHNLEHGESYADWGFA